TSAEGSRLSPHEFGIEHVTEVQPTGWGRSETRKQGFYGVLQGSAASERSRQRDLPDDHLGPLARRQVIQDASRDRRRRGIARRQRRIKNLQTCRAPTRRIEGY